MKYGLIHDKESDELKKLLTAPSTTAKDTIALIKKYRREKNPEKKHALREQIFNNNVKYIRKQAWIKAKRNPTVSVEDLFNAGTIGFLESIDKFKLSKKFQFLTYATFWIHKSMYECVHSENIIHMSRSDFFDTDSKVREKIKSALNQSLVYLNSPVRESGEEAGSLLDFIADEKTSDSENEFVNKEFTKDMQKKLINIINKKLTKEERQVIKGLYLENKTTVALKKELDATWYIIGQLEKSGLDKIKKYMKFKTLKRPKGLRMAPERRAEFIEQAKERLKRINSDPEMIKKRSAKRKGYVMPEEQRLRISQLKKNPSPELRKKFSAAQQNLTIETAILVKKMLLSGNIYSEIKEKCGISRATIDNILNDKLAYLRYASQEVTDSERLKIKELQRARKLANAAKRRKPIEKRAA